MQLLAVQHLDVAATYNNIANVYDRQGHYERTLEYYQKSLDIQIRVVGYDHPSVAKSNWGIGGAYYCQGRYEEALVQYQLEKALQVFLAVRPGGQPRKRPSSVQKGARDPNTLLRLREPTPVPTRIARVTE